MMDRRDFLRKMLMALPVGSAIPWTWFSSCTPNSFPWTVPSFDGVVGVIGGGVAGLQAALTLQQQGIQVKIFEAASYLGGRILSQFPGNEKNILQENGVELGADFIFGPNTFFYQRVRSSTSTVSSAEGIRSYMSEGTEFLAVPDLSRGKDYNNFISLRDQILESEDSHGSSIEDFISKLEEEETNTLSTDEDINAAQTTFTNLRTLARGLISNQFGLSLQELTVGEYLEKEKQRTESGKPYSTQNKSLRDIVNILYGSVESLVQRRIVSEIEHAEGEKIRINFQDGQSDRVDKLIVALPLGVIKNDLKFQPQLPEEKLQALDEIEVTDCLKIFLRLSERIWSRDLRYIYLPTSISTVVVHPHKPILMGYAFGQHARDFLKGSGAELASTLFIDILDRFFGEDRVSKHLRDTEKGGEAGSFNWSRESKDAPYTKGGFSYIKTGNPAVRTVLSQPIRQDIFFAGEYTHDKGHAGTIHGAMETGHRAAYEVMRSF
ncbi:MAG: NAD(P)/FAD-dependent oxidoreductase [Cytophagales bacterium]|nr:NAD(P)/FAD-dependent oxidoreductase [Cytophagales bacterium]